MNHLRVSILYSRRRFRQRPQAVNFFHALFESKVESKFDSKVESWGVLSPGPGLGPGSCPGVGPGPIPGVDPDLSQDLCPALGLSWLYFEHILNRFWSYRPQDQ